MPVWFETISFKDIWHDDSKSFLERRDAIVVRFKQSKWYETSNEVTWLVEDLLLAKTPNEFNYYMMFVYDEADVDRVWIETF
ncbi:MAG: hypothetical protein ABR585_12805 [Gemmatimonadaceae bacterium]|nr:hypothetical protein [Actinomycetota bacterium]